MRSSIFSTLVLAGVTLLMFAPVAQCKDKKKKTPPKDPQDAIEVVGHIPLTGGAVVRFLSTQHYSSYYLYAEREGGKGVTLVDVSKASHPVVLADIASASGSGSGSLFAVAGTAALLSEETPNAGVMNPQTIRIMDYSDPKQPKVAREFAGVTAMSRNDSRGLIFLANPEGVWILRPNLAEDPEVERAYGSYVLNNR